MPLPGALATAIVDRQPVRRVVLVEGESDYVALTTLAGRFDLDLPSQRIFVVAMGGVTNTERYIGALGPSGADLPLAGLYDRPERHHVAEALRRTDYGSLGHPTDLDAFGFHACVEDLEDELIRALGVDTVLSVIETAGELGKLRTFQMQPEWRHQPLPSQLRRFLGTHSGRKIRYGRLLVEALDLTRVPPSLLAVLETSR